MMRHICQVCIDVTKISDWGWMASYPYQPCTGLQILLFQHCTGHDGGHNIQRRPQLGFHQCIHSGNCCSSSGRCFIGVWGGLWVGFSLFCQAKHGCGWCVIIIDHEYVVIHCNPCFCWCISNGGAHMDQMGQMVHTSPLNWAYGSSYRGELPICQK